MAKTPFRELETFKRGRAGEQVVAQWLMERGWYVIPSYDYAGEDSDKAPKLQGYRVGHPVPDLDCAKDGDRRWVEVKTKTTTIFWRKTQKDQHGIDLPLLQHYQTVQKITGTPVWLAIYEAHTGYLLASTIDDLGEPRIGKNNMDGKLLANWDRDRFKILHQFGSEA